MKRGIKTYILPLILAVALIWPVFAWAAEAPETPEGPEYSEEATAAVPTITVSGNVEPGEVISVTVEKAENALATTAAISTRGLQFLRCDSSFGTQTHVVFMNQLNRVTYQYKVSGAPQSIASFTLSDVRVLLSEDGEEESAPPVRWRETVTGDPIGPMPTVTPTTQPSSAPSKPAITGPVTIPGTAQIHVSGDLRSGGRITVEIGCAADGMEAAIRTQGLEFLEVNNLLSSESRVVLVNMSDGTSNAAVYTYRISAAEGETISVDVEDVIVSVNGQDVDGERSAWINVVGSGGGSADHSFGLSGGLSTRDMSSGQSAIVGLMAGRTSLRVSDLMRYVIRPSSGRVVVLDAGGNLLSDNSPIKSGDRLVALSASGAPTDSSVLAIGGDVLGKGTLSISQLVKMAAFVTGKSNPTQLEKLCADINLNDRLEISDLVGCARHLNG